MSLKVPNIAKTYQSYPQKMVYYKISIENTICKTHFQCKSKHSSFHNRNTVNISTLVRSSVTSRFWLRASWFSANLPGWTSWNFGLIFLRIIKSFILALFRASWNLSGQVVRTDTLSSNHKLYTGNNKKSRTYGTSDLSIYQLSWKLGLLSQNRPLWLRQITWLLIRGQGAKEANFGLFPLLSRPLSTLSQ